MRRKLCVAAFLVVLMGVPLFESITHIGRGWWRGEAFYNYRPTSYWARELPRWRIIVFT